MSTSTGGIRVFCTICTDILAGDFAASPCGHTFHYTCLLQWLEHQKSCPQCRVKCLVKNVIKLYVDSRDVMSEETETLQPSELKEKVNLQANLLKQKEKSLAEANSALEEVKEELEAWQAQHNSVRSKWKAEQAANSTIKKQLKMMHAECEQAKKTMKEANKMKSEVCMMKSLKEILDSTRDDAESILKSYSSPGQLATFAVALKRDYETLKERKTVLQKEKVSLQSEVSLLKKQLRGKDAELQGMTSKLSLMEKDLQLLEQEKENLLHKAELLQKALDSPNSRAVLKRVLESPMPECIKKARPDVGPSPLVSSRTSSSVEPRAQEGKENSIRPAAVLLPVTQVSRTQLTKTFASGFNGMGGQADIVFPTKPLQQKATSKQLKFAPHRPQGGSFKPKAKPRSLLPALQIKF